MDLFQKMALRRWNFFIPLARVFLWSCATFIMLSGTVSGERQCYWCGPLAEQVHRSRRAPPCDVPTGHVTTCEPGLTHCAIVATSPPHVESRLCVKIYQDECYPLFCNSTKTWKMTCPCRDDLCNGNNTERENQAFALLHKLVAKSHNLRIQKRELPSSNLTVSKRERTFVITNITDVNEAKYDEMNEIDHGEQMIVITAPAQQNLLNGNDNVDSPNVDLKEDLSTDNPMTSDTEQNDSSVNLNITTQNSSDLETTKPDFEITSQTTNKNTAPITPIATMTEFEENLVTTPNLKSKEQLPTAEALHQNVSPSVTSTKTTESITSKPTDLSSRGNEDTTTVEPTKTGGNFAEALSLNFTLLAGFLFFYLFAT